jgi:sugar/nucleoside kinase (ribokinase family)
VARPDILRADEPGIFVTCQAVRTTARIRRILSRAHPLIVNESELSALTGTTARTPEQAFHSARTLCLRGVESVVATLGAAGSVWAHRCDAPVLVSGGATIPTATAGTRTPERDGPANAAGGGLEYRA